ncbi:hypothetical protein FA15DRAFT_698737 [Coprinopsis marcescibilis]|uniref:BTB domain-containing protein n=1 Tax=Coprinopsis marcescibilis TaxID=230819 RepID=A0A5C3K9G5_COPMA|nr:hypothetical protein FA15DRAFT_698737 [Coprinopsis marcescibilis]
MDLPAAFHPNSSMENVARVDSFYSGRILWFKVEGFLFAVGRDEFAALSDVFAGMYLLPSNEAVDGRDESHPIMLEGYLKADFRSLLKVMYPTSRTLILGEELRLDLCKDEWIGVLKLSTIWNMSTIRQYAISRLSKIEPSIPNIEKIQLARAHRVGRWLEEGVKGLLELGSVTLSDLEVLGWKTAAVICHIRESSNSKGRPDTESSTGPYRFRLDSIKCGYCTATCSLAEKHPECGNCHVPFNNARMLRCQTIARGSVEADSTWILTNSIQCIDCSANPFGESSFNCHGTCGFTRMNSAHKVRVSIVLPNGDPHALVEDYFGEEIKEYKLHDV